MFLICWISSSSSPYNVLTRIDVISCIHSKHVRGHIKRVNLGKLQNNNHLDFLLYIIYCKPHRELLLIIFIRIILAVPHISVPATISNLKRRKQTLRLETSHIKFRFDSYCSWQTCTEFAIKASRYERSRTPRALRPLTPSCPAVELFCCDESRRHSALSPGAANADMSGITTTVPVNITLRGQKKTQKKDSKRMQLLVVI